MRGRKKKTAKQLSIPGTDTELSKVVEKFVENKIEMAELKVEKDEIQDKLMIEMKKAGKTLLKIEHAGENWIVELLSSEEKIRCAKETKTPGTEAELDLG
jgi:hypothetical protein